jgi:hypothetical protein
MEARVLVEWLVEQAERTADRTADEAQACSEVVRLCSRARSISRFVHLWCARGDHAAAHQLAATERFAWPLPTALMDPWDLMQWILSWESDQLEP